MIEDTERLTADGRASPDFRAGFVALIGLPNVGKSTLLNALLGERLSIVTAKPQTTRQRLLGIYSDSRHQAVLVDTPGLLDPRYLLQETMRDEAERAIGDADLIVYVVDAGYDRSVEHARGFVPPSGGPAILCLNKVDRLGTGERQALVEGLEALPPWNEVIQTVGTNGSGVSELRATILSWLPHSPPFYPVDEVTTAPVRYFAAELIRETCFEELAAELPYSIAVEIDAFREGRDPLYIAAVIHVERVSQKGIVVGKGGRMIRTLGTRSRRKIERLMGRAVYLDLRVKVLPNWRRRRSRLKVLGYAAPPRSR